MPKPLTDLQRAAFDRVLTKLAPKAVVTGGDEMAIRVLEEYLLALNSKSKPVGRPRKVAHDPVKKGSCSCIDCRKRRKEARRDKSCVHCGSTGHDTGSNTCPGPDVQDRLEDPNRRFV